MKSLCTKVFSGLGLPRPVFRLREWIRALGFRKHSAVCPDGLPIPPARLIVLVTGSADARWYVEGGRLAAEGICETLTEAGVDVRTLGSIFDFGCGCGRVLRHWPSLTRAALFGSDCNPKLIRWCRSHLPFGRFQLNTLEPRLEYADEQFEFAYALSVFTHTPEDLQQPWINELWRILRPGGYLLMTTQGNEFLGKLSLQERHKYHEGRIVVRFEKAAGTNLCSTYHPQSYVRQKLAGKFSLTLCRAGAARGNGNQDIYLLRKATVGAELPQRSFQTAGPE